MAGTDHGDRPERLDEPQERDRSGFGRGFLIVAGVLFALGALSLVGLVGLVGLGFGALAEQVEADLADHPVILEQVGTIESLELDWGRSFEESHEEVFVFALDGAKRDAVLVVRSVTIDPEHEQVVWGRLEFDDGTTVDLFEDQGEKPR